MHQTPSHHNFHLTLSQSFSLAPHPSWFVSSHIRIRLSLTFLPAQGSVVSAIGRAINSVISAIANVIMTIINAIVTVRPLSSSHHN